MTTIEELCQWLDVGGCAERLAAIPRPQVADLGCGTGESTVLLAELFPTAAIVGLDTDLAAVEEARANVARAGRSAQVAIRCCDPAHLDGGPYDLVAILRPQHDPVAVLAAAKARLASGGEIVVAPEAVQHEGVDLDFRPMTADDLPLLHGWLQEPETQHWYRFDDLSLDGVTASYGPCLDGRDPTELWIAQVDGRDVGFLQSYLLSDNADYREVCVAAGADPAAGGIDYLLGDPGDRDHGLGSAVLRAFVDQVCFEAKGWPQVVSGPEPDNVRSWRALEKAGFSFLGEIVGEDGPERLMQRTRMPR